MTDHKELCEALRLHHDREILDWGKYLEAANLIEQQAARIAELERSPWRSMGEWEAGTAQLFLWKDGYILQATPSAAAVASGMVVAWMPIPKYQEPTNGDV